CRGHDVESVLEGVRMGEPPYHRVGMFARAVGEDELAAGQRFDRGAQRRIGRKRRMIDLVHEVEEVVRVEPVLGHQSAHGRAVAAVVNLLPPQRLLPPYRLETWHGLAAA